jgi:hypothetical protein
MHRTNSAALALGVALSLLAGVADGSERASRFEPKQIRIEYVPPKNAAHRAIYRRLQELRVLERLQTFLSPLRLPRPLPLRVSGCDGVSNAWYDEGVVTVCYEFLDDILKNASKDTLPFGVTHEDTVVGPLLDVFLHEVGHAAFDLLKVPLFGREEDAADMFSAYLMLQFGKEDARRLILGSAYQYKAAVATPEISLSLKKFSDEHGHPAQRFYNVLCAAYGADTELFADVVKRGLLPEERAEYCEGEYEQIAFAFKTLIGPYIDPAVARDVHKTWARGVDVARRRPPNR